MTKQNSSDSYDLWKSKQKKFQDKENEILSLKNKLF